MPKKKRTLFNAHQMKAKRIKLLRAKQKEENRLQAEADKIQRALQQYETAEETNERRQQIQRNAIAHQNPILSEAEMPPKKRATVERSLQAERRRAAREAETEEQRRNRRQKDAKRQAQLRQLKKERERRLARQLATGQEDKRKSGMNKEKSRRNSTSHMNTLFKAIALEHSYASLPKSSPYAAFQFSHPTKRYKCYICWKSYSDYNQLTHHLGCHKKPFICEFCPTAFADKTELQIHLGIHTGERPYKCSVCWRLFAISDNLENHSELHTGPYKCGFCTNSFAGTESQQQHSRIYIIDDTEETPIVQRMLNEQKLWKEKCFECNICHKSFSKKSTLRLHERIHTGERPYKCNICWLLFARSESLQIHMRLHTGEKPYECNVCQKWFTKRDNLNKHKKTHSGERPYKCSLCTKSFARTDTLRQHLRMHIKKNPEGIFCDEETLYEQTLRQNLFPTSTEKRELNFPPRNQSTNPVSYPLFQFLPFGCAFCDEMFEKERDFLDHCSFHVLNDPSGCIIDDEDHCLSAHLRKLYN